MELFLRMVGEGKLPNKQTINILMELLDEAGQFSKVGVSMFISTPIPSHPSMHAMPRHG